MKNYSRLDGSSRLLGTFVLALGILLAALPVAGRQSKDKAKEGANKGAGFILSPDATAHDVGLPVYPGARRLKDTNKENSALQMGLWGGSSGFKLALLKLESNDSPERVAAFYRKALARYGPVLDCGKSAPKHEKASGGQSNALECDGDQPVDGGFTFKAGTKEKQHVVSVEPSSGHSKIALVYVEAPKSGSKHD